MWRSFPAVLAALCLWAVATSVTAEIRRDVQAPAPVKPSSGIASSPTVHGLENAHLQGDGTLVVAGRLSGTGTVHAEHVIIEGTLAPGNSPGCISFGGNVTFSFSATLLAEISGPMPCAEYDRISVADQLIINGATLQVVLLGYVPMFGARFDIMDWGSLVGSFGTVDTSTALLPAPLAWDTSQLYLSGELVVGVQHYADGDLAPWNAPDGNINAADVLIAIQLALGLRIPGALQFAHGDMNADDMLDLADLLLIQQAVLQ